MHSLGVPQRRRVRHASDTDSHHPCPSPASQRDSHAASTITEHEYEYSSVSNGSLRRGTFQSPPRPQHSPPAPSAEAVTSASRATSLSHILHLSHDPVPNDEPQPVDTDSNVIQRRGIDTICADLEISPDVYMCLLNAYFDNMAAFSIFHRPTFAVKVSSISSTIQQRALIASMFACSSRFTNLNQSYSSAVSEIRSYDYFRQIAEESVDQALRECLDESPPLCLLQALILTTFQQLTNGVRGRSWRALHNCVSIAYDLHLHLVDKSSSKISPSESECILFEEKRRAWWTIWEFDVFASTIRKLPTAIDWTNNETWLPIEDELWFNNATVRSCTLNPDSALAWKELENCGNKSSKAWFIVANALMRSVHIVAFPHVYPSKDIFGNKLSSALDVIEAVQPSLDVLANSLYCFSASLPELLSYNGEFLNFCPGRSLHKDSAKHCIYIMMHLCRFMLHHLRVFNSTYRHLGVANSYLENHEDPDPTNNSTSVDKTAWNLYLAAASEIVTIVRNSSPRHVRYANPFLSSTIWLAAAAQIISQKIEPNIVSRRVAESNFDVLKMNLDAYVSFWGVSSTLQQKLKVLNARLETVCRQAPKDPAVRVQELPNLPNTTFPGINHTQQSTDSHGGFQAGGFARVQHRTLDQQAFTASPNTAQRPGPETWATPQAFDFEDGIFPGLDSSNTWEYGLDELLTYGGFE